MPPSSSRSFLESPFPASTLLLGKGSLGLPKALDPQVSPFLVFLEPQAQPLDQEELKRFPWQPRPCTPEVFGRRINSTPA